MSDVMKMQLARMGVLFRDSVSGAPETADGTDLSVPTINPTTGEMSGLPAALSVAGVQAGGAPLPTVCVFGDSFAVYDNYPQNGMMSAASSLWRIMLAKCGGHRMNLVNAGHGGDTAAAIRARLSSVPAETRILLGNTGANDFFGTVMRTAEDVLADVLYISDTLTASGVRVLWANAPVQATTRTNWSLARQTEAMRYNRMLEAANSTRPLLTVLDLAACMIDKTDLTNFAPEAGMIAVSDGIHPSAGLSHRFASKYYSILDKLLPAAPRKFCQADAYTLSWSDSLLPAGVGQMAGSGGSAGTNTTGTIPAGWTVAGTASAAVVCSSVSDPDGNWLEAAVTVSGAATYQQIVINTASFHARIAVGDTLRLMFEMELEPGATNVSTVIGRIYTYDGTTVQSTDWGGNLNGEQQILLDATKDRFAPITVPITITGNARTVANVFFYLRLMGTGTAKLRIRNVKPFKV